MMIPPGSRLGPYQISARIGAGGMGEVYRARDTRLERNVAIKVLPTELASNAQFKLRFEREAKTISQLNHPHICSLYDVGEETNASATVSYLVMEYLEGETLADRISKGALPIGEALKYGIQIADALDKAHRQGITHRDLKPGNVMLTKAGAKLLDFGLAKSSGVISALSSGENRTELKPDHLLTQEGTILGTIQYMSPEQIAGEEADPRSDIWALGCVLYEMATGRRAFLGKNRTSLIGSIVGAQPEPISAIQPLTPAALDHVIAKCLEKDPDERWQSAHDVAEELKWTSERDTPLAGGRRSSRVWRERAIAVVAIAVTIASVVLGYLWRNARATPERRVTSSILAPASNAFNFESGAMALSPDGAHLAFVASSPEGRSRLFVQDLEDAKVRPLESTDNAWYPFWSPNGRYVGFFADGKLKSIDARGGPPQTLADAPEPRGGSWSSEGTIVFTPRFREGLYRVEASGGKPEQISKLNQGEISHRWAHFLPDGEHLLFLVQRAEGGAHDDPSTIEILSLAKGDRRELIRANSSVFYSPPGHLLFWREGSLLAQRFDPKRLTLSGTPVALAANVSYSGTEQAIASASQEGSLVYHAGGKLGQSRLVWSTRSGIHETAVQQTGDYWGPALSPDGSRLVVSLIDQTEDLRLFDVQRQSHTRLTFHSADEDSPVWSPDGEWIAFRSNRSDPGDVYVKAASGQGSEQPLLIAPEGARPTGWSPDGKTLLIEVSDAQASTDIWAYSFAQKKATVFSKTPFSEGEAVVSPNMEWIAYSSDESGRLEIYVQPADGRSGKWQISSDGGRNPRWRRDGKELFYLGPSGAMMAVKVESGTTFAAGKPELLFSFREKAGQGTYRGRVASFDVNGAGDKFLLNMVTANTDAPVTLVQRWTTTLPEP